MSVGFFDMPWWGYVLTTLALTHITIASVTIFLHRHQAHRALDLHPIPSHFFRFWLWLTTGQVTKEWASIHRKHHAKCETVDDPHSPQILGIRKVLLEGYELYKKESRDQETMTRYGHGTPDDWLERNVYTKRSTWGVALLLVIDLSLFGAIGLTIWAVQMLWIPVTAAGIINGAGIFGAIAITNVPTLRPTSSPGASSSAAKNCITIITPTPRPPNSPPSLTNSTSAGCTSALCKPAVWRKPKSCRRKCVWTRAKPCATRPPCKP